MVSGRVMQLTHHIISAANKTQKPNLYFNVINFINDFKLLVQKLLAKFHFVGVFFFFLGLISCFQHVDGRLFSRCDKGFDRKF